jgi:bifunctional oligoribonuclease and PAP phosphatase NrnA
MHYQTTHMTHQDINEIKELLSEKKQVVIIAHKNPDGDAMGSSLGLYNFLLRKDHAVKVVTPNGYPTFLQWLPGNEKVIEHSKSPEKAEAALKKADIIFCLDFNALNRIGDVGPIVKKSKAIKILIDHHLQPEKFADYMLSDKRSCSTAQLVFDFITMLGEKNLINRKVANCLYTGIMTDTLNFRISTTSAHTHRIVSELIDAGAQNTLAYSNIFDTYTEDRVRLLGHCLGREMKVLKEFNAAFIALSRNDLKKFNFQKGDTEGFVNYPLSIAGIKFTAMFMEMGDEIKISFRSKGNFDVNKFSRKHFNGGGHANASGGEAHGSLDEAVTKFVSILSDYKDELLK